MSNRMGKWGLPLLTALVLVLLMFVAMGAPPAVRAVGEPPLTSTSASQTYTFYSTAITQSTTTNTAQPLTTAGVADASRVDYWTNADVFVSAVFSGTGTITATVQFSADGSNWVDADYQYVDADELLTATYQEVLSASGAEYMRVPVAGQYMRVQMVTTGLTTNEQITPRVDVTFRN